MILLFLQLSTLGKNTVILVPISFLLKTLKYPLWLSIIHFAIDSPSPVPPFFLTLAVSALKKRSNICGISSLSIPIPLSCI